jgi:hypothetical protein
MLEKIAPRLAYRRHTWHLETPFPGLADAVGNAGLNGSAVRVLAVAPLTGFVIGLRGEL